MMYECRCYNIDELVNDYLYELRGTYLVEHQLGNSVTISFRTTLMLIGYDKPELPQRTLTIKTETSCLLSLRSRFLEWLDKGQYHPDDYESTGELLAQM